MSEKEKQQMRAQAEAAQRLADLAREDGYDEGFRQGVQAAADEVDGTITGWTDGKGTLQPCYLLVDRIRALRPEGDKT